MKNQAIVGRAPSKSRRGWVFVSYAHDDEQRVRTIVKFLQSRHFDVWWDDLIKPGDRWGWMIREKLSDASCIVVVWSTSSVHSSFVESEARAALEGACNAGRLVPVLLDKDAAALIPLPFNVYQYLDLTAWNGRTRRPLAKLASVLGGMVRRPPSSEEKWGTNLADERQIRDATDASKRMRRLSRRIGSIGEILISDVNAVADLRASLDEVHKTFDVVTNAVEQFVAAGLTKNELDTRPYVRFERGALAKQIRDGRGHCDLIALHYGRPGGIRAWLNANAPRRVLDRADDVFGQLAEADGDLFQWLGRIGDTLTNESRVIVNLLTADQSEAAKRRVLQGRSRLEPLESDLQKSISALQDIEHSLGFAAT